MTPLYNWLKVFLLQHNLSAHSFVGLYGSFTTFLACDSGARDTVFGFLARHPVYYLLFNFCAFTYARYAGAHSTEGQIAELAAKSAGGVAGATQSPTTHAR